MKQVNRLNEAYLKGALRIKQGVTKIIYEEAGMGMVEIALIIIIIIALGLTFKKEINDFLLEIFGSFDLEGYN